MRTELVGNLKKVVNALASSIVIVCQKRNPEAGLANRQDFQKALRKEMPIALRKLQETNIAPVDLAQSAIGPGMAIFSRYAKVLEPNGDTMTVRSALQLINQVKDEVLSEQEGDFDRDTRWAVTWFRQHGFGEGRYGEAEELATAQNVSVTGLVEGGILYAKSGRVHLLKREELDADWDPTADTRTSIWEMTEHLILALLEKGESGAAELLAKLGGHGDTCRELAYLLYTVCEQKKWAQEALAYNSLVVAWPNLVDQARSLKTETITQAELNY